ncbi:unnamed protein product [Rotaria socialis]
MRLSGYVGDYLDLKLIIYRWLLETFLYLAHQMPYRFHQSQMGKFSITSWIRLDLMKRIKELGMNLLIYVMRIGTISQTEKDNVNMFCNVITGNMIPTICVITGCENEEPMTQWVTNNRHIFQQNGMVFMDMVGTCFASGGRFETSFKPLREDSARRVWDAITTHSAQEPVDFVKKSGGMIAVVKRVWNAFCTWIGQPAWRWVNEHVKNMLIRLGFRSDEADEIAEEF